MIEIKPRHKYLTKHQFVSLMTQVGSRLPFGITMRAWTEDAWETFGLEWDEKVTWGMVYDAARANKPCSVQFSIWARNTVPNGPYIVQVRIAMGFDKSDLSDPETMVKYIIEQACWLVTHEVQEHIARNVNYEELVPHGKNKRHAVIRWKKFKSN